MKRTLFAILTFAIYSQASLSAHCQMPCGIYHDDMVYDQIDQYVETMFKGTSMLVKNKFDTPWDRNEFTRWVYNKEKMSDALADLLTSYFLQQKIKPGEDDTPERLESAHKLLFLLVQIKQNTDRKFVEDFADEWDKFKLMFHVEGYACQIETLRLRKLELERKKLQESKNQKDGVKPEVKKEEIKKDVVKNSAAANHSHDHDHDHDHDHPHTH